MATVAACVVDATVVAAFVVAAFVDGPLVVVASVVTEASVAVGPVLFVVGPTLLLVLPLVVPGPLALVTCPAPPKPPEPPTFPSCAPFAQPRPRTGMKTKLRQSDTRTSAS